MEEEDDQQLLEALQPPLNLKELAIESYRGNSVFLSWRISLTNLMSLALIDGKNCEQLPPLPKLLSLEKLHIWGFKSVKRVGNEFLGIESDNNSSSSSVIAFPKLASLMISYIEELEERDYGITGMGNAFIMPRLSDLSISRCPKLTALPDHFDQMATLKELCISWGCHILKKLYRKGNGEDWAKISHIPNINI